MGILICNPKVTFFFDHHLRLTPHHTTPCLFLYVPFSPLLRHVRALTDAFDLPNSGKLLFRSASSPVRSFAFLPFAPSEPWAYLASSTSHDGYHRSRHDDNLPVGRRLEGQFACIALAPPLSLSEPDPLTFSIGPCPQQPKRHTLDAWEGQMMERDRRLTGSKRGQRVRCLSFFLISSSLFFPMCQV